MVGITGLLVLLLTIRLYIQKKTKLTDLMC